jgi:hypothetical protein
VGPGLAVRLTLRLLGTEIFHISTDRDDEPDGASLDGGTTSAYPMGFTPPQPPPYEHDTPPHTEEGWE